MQITIEAVVTLVVAAAIAIGGAIVYLRLRRPAGERFRRLLAEREEITVLMHPNPDPDAMASAVGVATLARQLDVEATIQYPGQIRHQENRVFRTVLELELERIDHVTNLATEDVVLVDHNVPRGFTGAVGILPFAIIDHHPGDGNAEGFTDVRTDYGSTASIVAEYFSDIGATPIPPDRHASELLTTYTLPSTVSTGLLYGILADTKHLTVGASAADFAAASYLYPGIDQDRLDRIANPIVDAEVLEVKARAIAGRRVRGPFAVCDVGTVSNADAIPQAADELVRLEGVTVVVVCGERDGTLYLSGRSRDDRVHMGRTLQTALDGLPNASAGGHARMGGGQIVAAPTVSSGEGSVQTASPIHRDELTERLFTSLAGDV
ncbi:DHH family phosphoesterase [Haloferacaceae archaeon DSL9]